MLFRLSLLSITTLAGAAELSFNRDIRPILSDRPDKNHIRLTFRFQGRDYRLTDVHGEDLKGILA